MPATVEPKVTPELAAAHGLKADEYARIRALIGRTPSFTKLGIFSAMWNEHCSCKSSRIHLRKLPTKPPWVIQGPGENAGVTTLAMFALVMSMVAFALLAELAIKAHPAKKFRLNMRLSPLELHQPPKASAFFVDKMDRMDKIKDQVQLVDQI